MKLFGALKIGTSVASSYKRFLFEKIRKVFCSLRRFNHQFKTPAYHQRLENFRLMFQAQLIAELGESLKRLREYSAIYMIHRYLRDAVCRAHRLNKAVLFAIEHSGASGDPRANRIIEFWNVELDFDAAPVVFFLYH